MDAKSTLGQTIKFLREKAGLSQAKLAAKADITYQYLSALENGKENFTVSVLEALALALDLDFSRLVELAYTTKTPHPVLSENNLIPNATYPADLDGMQLMLVLNEAQKIVRLISSTLQRHTNRPLSQYIQANNFSGIVSNILCDSFSRFTAYKHNHHQKYPDLIHTDSRGQTCGLEIKTTINKGKGGESHNGHSGWHLIACFETDPKTGEIQFVHVMLADLVAHGKAASDWNYQGSKKNLKTGSQRTETYSTNKIGTQKLRKGSVYLDAQKFSTSRWAKQLFPARFSSP
jgi:transcriptional regulator with XRE-family HTH domain